MALATHKNKCPSSPAEGAARPLFFFLFSFLFSFLFLFKLASPEEQGQKRQLEAVWPAVTLDGVICSRVLLTITDARVLKGELG